MRTRIALVAIIPVAVITVSTLTQAASVPSARASSSASSTASATSTTPVALPPSALAAYHGPRPISTVLAGSSLLVHLNPALEHEAVLHQALLQNGAAAATPAATRAAPAAAPTPAPTPPAGPVDTVTPEQRGAWERVAMCEEGGNWASDGGQFSGGLGISRANWIAYGGGEFAPEGAMATEDQQIMVAERIQSAAPDQNGCHGW